MNGLRDLIHEIHRRSIWQVLGIYIVASWVALQVADLLVDSFGLPEWLPPFALFLLVIGLPVVIATAFVQEGVRPAAAPPVPVDPGAGNDPGSRDVAPPNHADGPAQAVPALQRLFTWRNAISGGVIAFALWGVVATGVLLSQRSESAVAKEGGEDDARRSIAVLPFENLSPDPENAFFADGIHEDVLTHLSKIADLTVISRTSVLGYRTSPKPISEIGAELSVGAVVEGSVRRAGDEVRITAQLIDARTDQHLWAENYDRRLSAASVFALQTEIAAKIAEALAATLTPAEERRLARTPTDDLAAYDYYLRGRTTYQLYTPAGNDEAIRLYRGALERDPGYADAWAGLADAYGQRVLLFGYGLEWADSAQALAEHALELDPELPSAHKALALALNAQGKIRAALDANLRALALDPNHSEATNNAGVSAFILGRFDEALRYYETAYRLNPTTGFSSTNIVYALISLGAPSMGEERAREILELDPDNLQAVDALRSVRLAQGDYASARAYSQQLGEAQPNNATFRLYRAEDAYLDRDWASAIAQAREALRLSPEGELVEYHNVRTVLGISLLLAGQERDAEAHTRWVRDTFTRRIDAGMDSPLLPWDLAAVEAAEGRTDAAFEWLDRAYDAGWRWLISTDGAAFDSVRDDPRWQDFTRRIEDDLEQQRARAGVTPVGATP